ncbi:MAG: phenylacetate--CoA ligase family protein, partial [Thiolinea sp.]
PEILKARLVVDWQNEADQLTMHCEVADGSAADTLSQQIAGSIREVCKVRGEVELCTIGSLANDGVVISDIRKYE